MATVWSWGVSSATSGASLVLACALASFGVAVLGSRRDAPVKRLVALPVRALFLVSCALVRGGLFDSARYGDAESTAGTRTRWPPGEWPYRDFFDEYPVLAQPLFFVVHLLPGSFVSTFRWTMAVCGAAALVLMVAAMRATARTVAIAAGVVGRLAAPRRPVFLNTYDLFPALLTIAAVLAFLRERERTTYVLLALAVAAKVYPVVLAADRARRDMGAGRARGGPPRARVVRRRARARPPAVRDHGAGRAAVQLLGAAQARARGREPRRGDRARARPARPLLARPCATGARLARRRRHAAATCSPCSRRSS